MKLTFKSTVFLLLLLPLWSCNDSGKKLPATWGQGEDLFENKSYVLDGLGISMTWTAYKFTDKVAVSGTFEDYIINKEDISGSIEDILTKLKISIPTDCVDSGNAIRDFKIRTSFFEAFKTSSIVGTVLNAKEGEGTLKLKMNNISVKTPYAYSLQNDTILLFSHLDLRKWKGGEALNILEKECVAHLEGADGVSSLWPDVDVVFKLPVNKIDRID